MTIPPPDPVLVERFGRDLAALTGPAPGAVGVAVSGGADSLALLLLARAAFAAPPSPPRGQGLIPPAQSAAMAGAQHGSASARRCDVRAISIDHELRPAAADECAFVADVCARLGVPHETDAVTVRVGPDGLQAAARTARRDAFRRWADRHGLGSVLTAHHADDQAETVLMRLARGAGVGGLAGMAPANRLEGTTERPVMLLRPLLDWRRDTLAGIVAAAGLAPVADPSNADPRFDRTRFRALLATTDLLDPRRLASAASHCRDADAAIEWLVAVLADQHLTIDGEDRVLLAIGQWPREVQRRLVLNAFAAMAARPSGPETMRVIGLLHAGRTATLAGIKVTPGPVWTFTRAPVRRTG